MSYYNSAAYARRQLTTALMSMRPTATTEQAFADPSSRFWRTRIKMRNHIAEHANSGVVDQLVDTLYRLPGVWTEAQYADRMSTIRTLAMEAFDYGHICLSGTNDFLETFNMEPMYVEECGVDDYTCEDSDCVVCYPSTRKTVTVTVEITFTVDNTEGTDATESDVERYLSIDVHTDRVDDVDSDADWNITNVDVELDD